MRQFVSRGLLLSSLLAPALAAPSLVVGCASGGGDTDTGPARLDTGPLPMDGGADAPFVFPDTGMPGDTGAPPTDTGPLPDAGTDGGTDTGPTCVDLDMDGFLIGPPTCGELDCDDSNDAVNPGAVEDCNGLDDDCNGSIDDGIAAQTCGVGACEATVPGCMRGMVPTCEPGSPTREVCNAIDDDCDGEVDDGLGAPVVCGVGACQRMVPSCSTGGMMMTCVPGAPSPETCNGVDDDCNGTIDDGLPDATCGVGACRRTVATCVDGMAQACTPGAPGTEICNGLDDDCNGTADDGFGTTSCGVGACVRTVLECVMGVPQMCLPGSPSGETCNNRDDNCNGTVDDGLGSSTCGLGFCQRTTPNCVAGVPQTCTPGDPASESCNGVDDNCNGTIDDGLGSTTCGLGTCQTTVPNCIGGTPQTCVPGTPGTEICGNGLDENCNGTPDDGCTVTPPNNTCGGATLLSTAFGTLTGTIDGSTSTVSDCAYGNDLWYRITLAVPSILYVDTFGSGFDTSLSIRSACGSAPVACEDDDCGTLQDQAVASLPAGTHYIALHTRLSTTGSFTLRWQTIPTSNGTATRITAGGTFSGSTSGTGRVSGCVYDSGAPENLYYFTLCPATTRTVTASTCSGASWDTGLYLRSGGATTDLACADDSCGVQSSISGSASGPGLFGIYMDGYYTNSGSYSLTVGGLP
jgi:hypothetical protein